MTQPPGQPGPPQYGQPPAQFSQSGDQAGPQPYGQQQPPVQPYGQQQPPVQPYGQQATYAPPARTPISRTGLVFVVLGAIAIGVAFTILNWYHSDKGEFSKPENGLTTFSKIHKTIGQLKDSFSAAGGSKDVSFGVSNLYFAWLGWALFAAAVVFGLIAISQLGTRTPALKILAAVIAAAGLGITAWAVDLISLSGKLATQAGSDQSTYTSYLKHTSFGAWAAAAGFLLILIGSLLPARRD
jgi:hypothetical protein